MCTVLRVALALAVIATLAPDRARGAGTSFAGPGPFASGWRDVTVPRAAGGSFVATVYYPAAAPGGIDAPVDPAGGPHPAITFGHGFLQAVSSYSSTLRHLASWGFIVIAPRSYESSVLPSHSQFADDLRDGLTYLAAQNATPGALFFGRVAPRFGASGHSMGGGASLIAADRDPRILAVSNLAAAETSPSAIGAMAGITRPVQLIAGSQDAIVPPAENQAAQFNNGYAPKQAPLIAGGYHCGFQDASFPFFCDTGSISRTLQLSITRELLAEWFTLYLRDDAQRWLQVWGPPAQARPLVALASADGIDLAPRAVTATLVVGQAITFSFSLTNTGPVPAAYALGVDALLPVTPSITATAVITPRGGASFDLLAQPVDAGREVFTVTVRSLFDGGTTDWVNLTLLVSPSLSFTPSATMSLPVVPSFSLPITRPFATLRATSRTP